MKLPFFKLSLSTLTLLDTIFEVNLEEKSKQKLLIHAVVEVMGWLGLFLLGILTILFVAVLPVYYYSKYNQIHYHELDFTSLLFYGSVLLGSSIFFIYPFFKRRKDYSDWSKLLHQLILDNYNIARRLFYIEKKTYRKKLKAKNNVFFIVTGLARSGTTAMTKLLFETNRFHSLSYANMPFLLSINLWKKLYNPQKVKLKERAHGDKMMYGYNSIEAFDEYFFKNILNDNYIRKDCLVKHNIDTYCYEQYLNYQNLIKPANSSTLYLSKNNNFMLRYESMRTYNSDFIVIVVFRDPVEQSMSLHKQHKRLSKMQKNDRFVLQYMNWLGHHEFGKNHKFLNVNNTGLMNQYKTDSINYWLALWIDYYYNILQLPSDKNRIIIDYDDFVKRPRDLLSALSCKTGIELHVDSIKSFEKTKHTHCKANKTLLQEAQKIHHKLLQCKLSVKDNLFKL